MKKAMNEETLKNQIIIPFLNDLGFNSSLLSFEENFTIKLGKNTVKKKDYISGRLDILVKLNNEPFMLWELKKEKIKIADEEISQAISYSRLTEPMTPFTIISNGEQTHIFNTFTKQNIEKDMISTDLSKPHFQDTIKLRIEALSDIICYSGDNLKKFINRINNRELLRLYGNKYIKELYVERKDIHKKFDNFVNSDKKLFFITGTSGIGKTNTLCNLVENYMNDNLILFYNSCFIETSIIDQIMDDFNFGFNEQLYNKQLFDRINLLSKKENKYFIICIDAIDELAVQNPAISVDKLLNIALEYSNIKICISCKDSFIKDYEEINGTSSVLKSISRENIKLLEFNEDEGNEVINKYKNYFQVEITEKNVDKLKKLSYDGFLFRIIFESFKGKIIDKEIDNISVIEKYIDAISKNHNINKKDLLHTLEIIGEVFVLSKDDIYRQLIDELTIESMLKARNCKISVETLAKINILQLYHSDEINYVDFNFKALSYYVITILYAKLNIKKGKEFINILFELNNNRRCKEALSWYSNNIKNFQYRDIYKFKEQYGKKLIFEYRNIVNKNFPSIRDKFELNTDINNIGIAIDNSDIDCAVYTFSFYIKSNFDDDVRLIDFREKNILDNYKIKTIHSSMVGIDINHIIKSKLKDITQSRSLDESYCKNLNTEYILAYTFKYGKYYGLNYKYERPNFIPNFNELTPLDLFELRRQILMFNIKNLKQMNIIEQELSTEELYIKQISGDITIPECNYIYSGMSKLPIYSFANIINDYIAIYSENVISKPHVILPSNVNKPINASYVTDIIIGSFTKDELKNYLSDVLSKYIDEYIILVENNFPTLKHKMRFYNLFKNGVSLTLFIYKKEKPFLGSYSENIWYCYNDDGLRDVNIIICDEKDIPKEPNKRWLQHGGISNLFFNEPINKPQYQYQVLSNLIYELLDDDLKDIIDNEDFNFFDN